MKTVTDIIETLKSKAPYLIIALNIGVLLAVAIYPFLYSIYISAHIWPLVPYFSPKWVGFGNYLEIITDPDFLTYLTITAQWVGGCLGIETLLGLLLALLMQRELRILSYLRAFFSIPILMAPVTVGLVWRFLYNPVYGPLALILEYIGITVNFTGNPTLALWSIIIADVWQWTPFAFLVILSALLYVPREQYEAAEVDGASYLQKLRHVTFPNVKPVIGILILLRGAFAFGEMDKIYAITRGGPGISTVTLVYYAFQHFQYRLMLGYSAAICFIVVLLVNIFYLLFSRLIKLE